MSGLRFGALLTVFFFCISEESQNEPGDIGREYAGESEVRYVASRRTASDPRPKAAKVRAHQIAPVDAANVGSGGWYEPARRGGEEERLQGRRGVRESVHGQIGRRRHQQKVHLCFSNFWELQI